MFCGLKRHNFTFARQIERLRPQRQIKQVVFLSRELQIKATVLPAALRLEVKPNESTYSMGTSAE